MGSLVKELIVHALYGPSLIWCSNWVKTVVKSYWVLGSGLYSATKGQVFWAPDKENYFLSFTILGL